MLGFALDFSLGLGRLLKPPFSFVFFERHDPIISPRMHRGTEKEKKID
jgi:hypothetical protein